MPSPCLCVVLLVVGAEGAPEFELIRSPLSSLRSSTTGKARGGERAGVAPALSEASLLLGRLENPELGLGDLVAV